MNQDKLTARMAGLWYLLVAIFGSFNSIFVYPKLYVVGDAVATINAIVANGSLFRLGIACNIACTVCFLLLANSLYKLFKPVDGDLSRLMVIFIIASVPATYLEALKLAPFALSAQSQTLAMAFLDIYKAGTFIVYVFFGLWMFPLGRLVFKSGTGIIAKILGIMLMAGCFGYLANSLAKFLGFENTALPSVLMTVAIFAEISCIIWLMTGGPRTQERRE